MTISKKLLFSGILASIATAISAVSLQDFNTDLLAPYIARAEATFRTNHDTIQWNNHGPREILASGKSIAKKLYSAHKKSLKVIKHELKHAAQLCKDGDHETYRKARQLYKAFKHLVYKSWKKRVKAQYQESKKSNDLHAWGWIHNQKLLIIEKS